MNHKTILVTGASRGIGKAIAEKFLKEGFDVTGFDRKAASIVQEHYTHFCLDIRDKKQEHFVCLTLDGANRLIAKRTITIGTLTASLVHPREVFADAITDRAASIIVAHNHPSGNLTPSAADREVTARLHSAGELLGIDVIDHIIVTATENTTIL